MEIVYRIFTWIISGTAWLLLMLVFAPFVVITLDCWNWIILPLIYGGLLFYNLETQDKKRYPFSWILSDFNNSNNASCVPHEMLHNYGCEHTPADQLNIMYPIAGTNTVIRQPQWIKVR